MADPQIHALLYALRKSHHLYQLDMGGGRKRKSLFLSNKANTAQPLLLAA